MMVDYLTCSFCRARIREHEPDVVLWRSGTAEKYFYHSRCSHEPEHIVATDRADVWRMTHRELFWDMEGGAA